MPFPRVDPPLSADETTMLCAFLDHSRATLRRQTEGLDAEQLQRSLAPSTMTLGGLLKHLAWVENYWFRERFLGREPAAPWRDADWDADDDWEWTSAVHDSPEQLALIFDEAVEESRAVVAGQPDLGALAAVAGRRGRYVSLRWILVHMIEEYARHTGHADLLRESIDGARDL